MVALSLAERPVVLFDFDGTLADTRPAVMRCLRLTLEECGYDAAAQGDLGKMYGPPLTDGFEELLGCAHDEARELTAVYRRIFSAEIGPADYPAYPGVSELLRALSAEGRRIAIATSRLEASVLEMLAHLDLPPFDAVAGRLEPGRHSKADCIRAALAMLGAAPDEAVHVGDRVHDVEGAAEVGLPCIGVTHGDEEAAAELAGAAVVCRDAAELAAVLL